PADAPRARLRGRPGTLPRPAPLLGEGGQHLFLPGAEPAACGARERNRADGAAPHGRARDPHPPLPRPDPPPAHRAHAPGPRRGGRVPRHLDSLRGERLFVVTVGGAGAFTPGPRETP